MNTDIYRFVGHTKGPLTVRVSEKFPFDIETLDSSGSVVFRSRLLAIHSEDRSPKDAVLCRNFEPAERAHCEKMNRIAIGDEMLRAAAPDMLRLLQSIIGDLPSNRDWLDPVVEREATDLINKFRIVADEG